MCAFSARCWRRKWKRFAGFRSNLSRPMKAPPFTPWPLPGSGSYPVRTFAKWKRRRKTCRKKIAWRKCANSFMGESNCRPTSTWDALRQSNSRRASGKTSNRKPTTTWAYCTAPTAELRPGLAPRHKALPLRTHGFLPQNHRARDRGKVHELREFLQTIFQRYHLVFGPNEANAARVQRTSTHLSLRKTRAGWKNA